MRLIPDDRRDEENHILQQIKSGKSVRHFETVRRTKDGRLIDVSVTASPIKDAAGNPIGVSKVARDITERKRAEEARRASEARYRTLFEYAPDGIVIADPKSYLPRRQLQHVPNARLYPRRTDWAASLGHRRPSRNPGHRAGIERDQSQARLPPGVAISAQGRFDLPAQT